MKSIKQILLKKIIIATAIVLASMTLLCFVIESYFSDMKMGETAQVRLSDAKERISQSASAIAEVTAEMNEE